MILAAKWMLHRFYSPKPAPALTRIRFETPPRLRTASDLVTQAMKNGEKFAVKVSTESEQDVRIRRASEEKRLRCMNTSMTWGNLYHLL